MPKSRRRKKRHETTKNTTKRITKKHYHSLNFPDEDWCKKVVKSWDELGHRIYSKLHLFKDGGGYFFILSNSEKEPNPFDALNGPFSNGVVWEYKGIITDENVPIRLLYNISQWEQTALREMKREELVLKELAYYDTENIYSLVA